MLLDVAVAAVAEGGSADLLSAFQCSLTLELTTDEFECIHAFGSSFYNSRL